MTIPLEFDPSLCEEVALTHVLSEERAGRPHPYRRESEEIYRLPLGHERDSRFRGLAMATFGTLPAARVFQALLSEFEPRLLGVTRVVVQRALARGTEGAELHVGDGGKVVRTEITVLRMTSPSSIEELLRSEWTHVADMLDPAFGYVPEELERHDATPFDRRLVRDRYRVLWSTSVGGRLARAGRVPEALERERRGELDRAFAKVPEEARARCFDDLWSGPRPTHAALLALALDPAALIHRYAPGVVGGGARPRIVGDPCPLCSFPTWNWADADRLPPRTHEEVSRDFPSWKAAQGLCGRCEEVYRARTGCW